MPLCQNKTRRKATKLKIQRDLSLFPTTNAIATRSSRVDDIVNQSNIHHANDEENSKTKRKRKRGRERGMHIYRPFMSRIFQE